MPLTPNYNADPLNPEVFIYDLSDVLQYTFQTSATQASPTRDFELRSYHLHNGINDDYGSLTLLIDDPTNALTDTTNTRRPCKIKRQWNIQFKLGKSNSTLYRAFYGKIFEAQVIRPNTNLQQILISCVGWGVRLRDRQTEIKRFQKKLADGISLDTTDTNTRVSELAKDLVVDVDHYPYAGLTTESAITTTGVDVIDVKLPDLQLQFESWASALNFLSSAGSVVYGVDADRDLFFRDPFTSDSGFLFTNDLEGTDAQGWDSNKIGYLFRSPLSFNDSTYEGGYSILYGYGGIKDTVDAATEYTSSNATYTAHETNYIAIPITPSKDNISKIAFKMSKTGTPALNATIQIIGQDGSATPEETDLRQVITIPKEKLQALTATPTMTEIAMKEIVPVTPLTQIYLVVNKYGSAGNEINLDYTTGTGTYYTSTNGTTWASNVGRFNVRTYHSKSINVIVENTVARAAYGIREKAIPFRNKIDEATVREALINASTILGKEKRIYSSVEVSAPTDRIPLGKFCRVYDSFNGMDIKAQITGVDVSGTAGNNENKGTNKVTLTLVDYYYSS